MTNDNPWTESQTAALRHLWTETEFSASEIAMKHGALVGDRTRDAILGKVHRLKLPMRCPAHSHPGPRRRSFIKRERLPRSP